MQKSLELPIKPERILVIIMRYLGDVLLTTPLISSIKEAYQAAEIDVLVFKNTAAMLDGFTDINNIITIPNKPTLKEQLTLYRTIFSKYDLVVNTQTGDRPFFASVAASPNRIGAIPKNHEKGHWKRFFYQGWTEFDDEHTHTVLQHLKLADVLNIPRVYQVTPPNNKFEIKKIVTGKYAVLHPHPKWHYKRWPIKNWINTATYLEQSGLQIIISGGSSIDEINYISQICDQLPDKTINLSGKLSLAELSTVIKHAQVFIGPDTGITHLAAATGVPVIALFGPTNPVKWAPWPYNYDENINPFKKIGNQNVSNVTLTQGPGDCVPCHKEGCEQNRMSFSRCLESLSFKTIKPVIDLHLQNPPHLQKPNTQTINKP